MRSVDVDVDIEVDIEQDRVKRLEGPENFGE